MRLALLLLSICLLPATWASAADMTTIDDFEGYADAAAVRAAWTESQGAPPAELMPHGDGKALKLNCTFTNPETQRGCYDRNVQLDLTLAGSITFDFYCDDPAPLSYCAVYFRSGEGWYASSFGAEKGWQHVTIGKGIFRVEGTPNGWGKIDGVRVSAWKGKAQDTYCGFDNLGTRTEDIAVVSGATAGAEARAVQEIAGQLADHLDKTGIAYGALTEGDVEAGALRGKKLAIFPYSPEMSEAAVQQTLAYLTAGGKIIVFYSVRPALAEALGLADVQYSHPETPGTLADVAFEAAAVPGLPAKMYQNSWNTQTFTPGGHNARVIGTWRSEDGKLGAPAVLLSDSGAYMGHVLTQGDPDAKQAFLMALIGHFVPGAWETATATALQKAQLVGPYGTREALDAYLASVTPGSAFEAKVKAAQAAAAQAEATAKKLLGEKRYPEALGESHKVHAALQEAYFVAHKPRTAEFRAVWNHSGTGDCGSWEDAMQRLKAGGFNAVVPNMWWGGVAYYDSKLLPHGATFEKLGDQITQCVAAGKKYGIEVHPWKVNWNLGNAPQSFIDKMRAEQRLQMTAQGKEEAWLCPSNPQNFELERDTMLEVVRNYDVDGVHFDYIRYPDNEHCYCAGCRERFEAARGAKVANWPADCYSGPLKAEYRDFRCAQITRLVKAVSEEAHRLKPWIRISAAVFSDYPSCREQVGQDWVLWCKQGWLDFVCPMDYSETDGRFRNLVTNQAELLGGCTPLYAGIGAFINPDDETLGQMEIARECGADGFVLFNMGKDLADQGFPRFAQGITAAPAIIPHNGPRVQFASDNDNAAGAKPIAGASLAVQVTVVDFGVHRDKAMALSGALELQDMSGNRLADLGRLPQRGRSVTVTVPRQAVPVRLAAVGDLGYPNHKEPFVVRSRPYVFAK